MPPTDGSSSVATEGVRGVFWRHGRLCAAHPWEVIFIVVTMTVLMMSDWRPDPPIPRTPQEMQGLDVLVMMTLRCSALLYTYHQFRQLHVIGSKYILGIAGLFAVFSSFVFSCTVIKLLDSHVSELKDALFFFLLLVDLSKASALAQLALTASSQAEVRDNIAHGMGRLGPALTLDTIVEALVIGAGTLSGVSRLEQMCCFAVISVVVNYVIFMTFFPACLSLVLELSNRCSSGRPPWQLQRLARILEDEERPNPVVQRVKVIMSAGLLLVHGITRLAAQGSQTGVTEEDLAQLSGMNVSSQSPYLIVRWLNAGLDQAVFMVLLAALVVKYIVFESQGQLEGSLLHPQAAKKTSAGEKSTTATEGKILTGGKAATLPAGEMEDKQTQTTSEDELTESSGSSSSDEEPPRTLEECLQVMKSEGSASSLKDEEVAVLVGAGQVKVQHLETALKDPQRAVAVRRKVILGQTQSQDVEKLPYHNYDFAKVMGACCENVIGYMPVPVGVAGPLLVDGVKYFVPMSTTEGVLVASTNRGCRALSNGVSCSIVHDGMTRAPVIKLPTATLACEVLEWIRRSSSLEEVKTAFDATSRFARLQDVHGQVAGRHLYLRFRACTGDAMGMNMVSKGTEAALECMKKVFSDIQVISISGNFCTDKKPNAINWVQGRGKSVVAEAIVPALVVRNVLKTRASALVELNICKNLVGSSLAGSIGGNNAHAANIVSAVFIATGQDPAQVVGSSNCMTLMEPHGPEGEDLWLSVTMPSLEVGTVGGGTILPPQATCLHMLGVKGAHPSKPGENARQLAKIIAATVMAGELSLMASLASGDLVKSHMQHNRAKPSTSSQPSSSSTTTSARCDNICSSSSSGDAVCSTGCQTGLSPTHGSSRQPQQASS